MKAFLLFFLRQLDIDGQFAVNMQVGGRVMVLRVAFKVVSKNLLLTIAIALIPNLAAVRVYLLVCAVYCNVIQQIQVRTIVQLKRRVKAIA